MAQILGFIFIFGFYGNLSSIDPSNYMAHLTTSIIFVFLRGLDLKLIILANKEL